MRTIMSDHASFAFESDSLTGGNDDNGSDDGENGGGDDGGNGGGGSTAFTSLNWIDRSPKLLD